tara:strand:- start:8 stop:556 length:549 start_codon:yes stop_codon:yes gene_type:complete
VVKGSFVLQKDFFEMSAPEPGLSADHTARFFHETAEMLLVLSCDLNCITASPPFCIFTGQSSDLIFEQPVKQFIYADDWPNFSSTLTALRNGEKITRFDVRVKMANGEIHHVDWSARRVDDTLYCGLSDASEWLWRDSMRAAHQDILSSILNREDLNQILAAVCKHMEVLMTGPHWVVRCEC